MKKLSLGLLLVLLVAPLAGAQELKVEERRLDNGLTVLIVERHDAPVVSFNIKFRVGSVDEDAGRTGVAHILEHMLFKGTDVLGTKDYEAEKPLLERIEVLYNEFRRAKWALPAPLRNDTPRHEQVLALIEKLAAPVENGKPWTPDALAGLHKELTGLAGEETMPLVEKLVGLRREFYGVQKKLKELVIPEEDWKILEANGARGLNASTSPDTTQYFYSLPSNRIELWALVESGRLRNPVLRQFYKEKEAVKEERRLRLDSSPGGMHWAKFMATAYAAHPYRWPTIGWIEDIEEVSRTEVEEFFRQHYAPNRAVATVVGDVDPDELMKVIDSYFGDIPAQPAPRPVVTKEPPQMGERRARLVLDSNPQPRVLIGYHRPALGHPDMYVLDVIIGLLQIGQTSRLTQSIYFQQQLGQVQAGNQDSRFPGLFLFSGAPLGAHTTEEIEKAIYAELEKLKNEPVTARELQKIKNQNEMQFLRQMRDNATLAETLGTYEVLYGWEYVKTYRQKLAAVTPEDIQRVAKKYFVPDNRTVVTLSGPDAAKEEK